MLFITAFFLILSLVNSTPGPKNVEEDKRFTACNPSNQSIYDFQVQDLHGKFTDLTAHKGKVLFIVNVATYCAYTQQYLDFNPLIEGTGDRINFLAFPCNQFYLQEPAENHEIMNGILHVRPGNGWKPHKNIHIYGKLEVNGVNQHPLYEFLKDLCPQTVKTIGKREEMMYNPIQVNDITWNFEKFLIDKKGKVRYRFHPTAWRHGEAVKSFLKQLMAES